MSLFNFDPGSSDRDEEQTQSSETNADSQGNVEFVPPIPKPTVGNVANIASAASDFITSDTAKKMLNIASALRDGDPTKAASVVAGVENAELVSQLIEAAVSGINVQKNADMSPPTGGGGGGRGFDNSYANATRLSLDPAPTEVRLATGIKPNTFSPEYQISEEAYASPLHVSLVNFRFPTNTTINVSAKYYSEAILFDLLNRVQRNISFTLPAGFTTANLVTTLNHLCAALEIYYSVTRLLVYGNDPMNKNEGLLFLRSSISSSVGEEYLMLKRVLDGLPIPPNLNTLIYWMSQIYLSSELPGSPAIMFSPHNFTNGAPTWSEISTVRANLISSTSTTVFSVLGKAIPNWYSTKLLTGVANPLHDPNFSTVWTNAPYWCSRVTAPISDVVGPGVTDVDSGIRYNAWTNNLDGGAFALMSCYKTTTTTGWIPGMLTPFRTQVDANYNVSRISFMDTGGITKFYASDNNDSLCFARDETHTTSVRFAPLVNGCLQFGTERCWGVTPRTILDCTNQLMDWLLSFDTIPYKNDRSLVGGMSSSIPGGYKNNSKSGAKSKPNPKRGKRGKSSSSPSNENSFIEEL